MANRQSAALVPHLDFADWLTRRRHLTGKRAKHKHATARLRKDGQLLHTTISSQLPGIVASTIQLGATRGHQRHPTTARLFGYGDRREAIQPASQSGRIAL